MSLDVYLTVDEEQSRIGTGVFVRENGANIELTAEQVMERFGTHVEPTSVESHEVYWGNITHNLGEMAHAAGLYDAVWRPEEHGIETAEQLIQILADGLAELLRFPEKYEAYNPENGWGSYESLCEFLADYLSFCREYPRARVRVSR